jgi:PAS domain S-box-containing protein
VEETPMAEKPSYEDLEQRVQELEKEVFDLRHAKQAAGQTEENINSLVGDLRDGFFTADTEGTITYVNKAFCEIFGYETQQEVLGKHFSENIPPEGIDEAIERFNRAINDKDCLEVVESPSLMKDGSTGFVQLLHSPVIDGEKIVGIKGTLRDITAQKNAENALLESERWKRALLDAITESVFLIDREENIQAINKTAAERFGGTVDTFTGTCIKDFMPPHLSASRQAKHDQVFESGVSLCAEDERDGETYDTNIYPICDEHGEVTSLAIYSTRITEQKRALDALSESEDRYRSLFEDSHSTMLLIDPDTSDIVDANPAACAFYGYSREEITNKKITDINILPREEIRRQLRGPGARTQRSFYFQHRLANGKIRNVECFISPITLEEKEYRYTMVYDITERVRAEEALQESVERTRALLNAITESAILADLDGNIHAINETAARRFGGTVEKLTDKCIWDLLPPSDVNLRKAKHDEAIQSGAPVRFNAEREGEFYDSNLNPVFDRDGRVMSLAIFAIQITEQKRALEALRESEEKYRLLIESMNDGLAVLDDNNLFTHVNDRFLDMIGYTRDEVIGKNPKHYCSKTSLKLARKQIVERRKGKKGFYETHWVKKHGGHVPTIMSASPIMTDSGHYEGSIAVIIDITQMKRIEKELREREKELKTKTHNLEEVNAALRVLLKQREKDKTEIEQKLLFNVKELVLPYLVRMKDSGLDTSQNAYISILESNLNDIISPFSHTLSTKYGSLTPTEIQVANLIKQGSTTKEIASSFHISSKTIEDHRKNIRKKLGITNRKTNLRTHLLAVQ